MLEYYSTQCCQADWLKIIKQKKSYFEYIERGANKQNTASLGGICTPVQGSSWD